MKAAAASRCWARRGVGRGGAFDSISSVALELNSRRRGLPGEERFSALGCVHSFPRTSHDLRLLDLVGHRAPSAGQPLHIDDSLLEDWEAQGDLEDDASLHRTIPSSALDPPRAHWHVLLGTRRYPCTCRSYDLGAAAPRHARGTPGSGGERRRAAACRRRGRLSSLSCLG